MTVPSDLRAHERPKPPKVKRACGRCDPDWNDDFTKRVVVSPDGVAHFAQSDGKTECGIDATGDDWWRRPAVTVPPDVRALVRPIHDMIDEGLGWNADYENAMAALAVLLDRLAHLERELRAVTLSCSAEAKKANRLTARIQVLDAACAKHRAQERHDQAYIDALEGRLESEAITAAGQEISARPEPGSVQ